MKNITRIWGVIVFTLVVNFFFYLVQFEKSLTGKPTLAEESKVIVSEYLQKNYPEIPFTIKENVDYIDELYWVGFISQDGKVEGYISVNKGEIYSWGDEQEIYTMEQSKEYILRYLLSEHPEQTFFFERGTYSEGNYIFRFISKDASLQGKISIGVRSKWPNPLK